MSLNEKIKAILDRCNEVSFGYNDSGCFWHFQYGVRGCGNMMEGFGKTFAALDSDDFEEAVDQFLKHLEVR